MFSLRERATHFFNFNSEDDNRPWYKNLCDCSKKKKETVIVYKNCDSLEMKNEMRKQPYGLDEKQTKELCKYNQVTEKKTKCKRALVQLLAIFHGFKI